jgi:hypothetical protein
VQRREIWATESAPEETSWLLFERRSLIMEVERSLSNRKPRLENVKCVVEVIVAPLLCNYTK